ncbi:hypothetical protein Lal_00037719 [Lupinus albus]|nr:hypothetical protein Lal_00037719 [Lupinus albus]
MFKIVLQDDIFYEGKVYALNCHPQLYEFDVTTSIGGDLLIVSRFLNHREIPGIDDPEVCSNTVKFEID